MWYKSVIFGAQVYSWGFGGSAVGGVGALGHGSKDTVLEPKLIEVLHHPYTRHRGKKPLKRIVAAWHRTS